MGRLPLLATVRKHAESIGISLEPADMQAVCQEAVESDDWRLFLQLWIDNEADREPIAVGPNVPRCAEPQPEEHGVEGVDYISIRVPIATRLPDGGGFFSVSKFPRSLGAGSPISLSFDQGQAYARLFRGLEHLAKAGRPLIINAARTQDGTVRREAIQPYDAIRFILEQVSLACAEINGTSA